MIFGDQVPRHYRVIDPRTGALLHERMRAAAEATILDVGSGPRVYICADGG